MEQWWDKIQKSSRILKFETNFRNLWFKIFLLFLGLIIFVQLFLRVYKFLISNIDSAFFVKKATWPIPNKIKNEIIILRLDVNKKLQFKLHILYPFIHAKIWMELHLHRLLSVGSKFCSLPSKHIAHCPWHTGGKLIVAYDFSLKCTR